MAAEFTLTLSHPTFRSLYISSSFLIPPPTVSGIKISRATSATISTIVSRLSLEAVISKKVISSAPSSLYLLATSTGSPASLRPTKFTPLTTRPSLTSRQGIIL